MKAESHKLELKKYLIKTSPEGSQISAPGEEKSYPISKLQIDFLNKIVAGKTIELMVVESLVATQIFPFRELHHLMEVLAQLHLFRETRVEDYFLPPDMHPTPIEKPKLLGRAESLISKWTTDHLLQLPYFRGLSPDLQKSFLKHASLEEVPERTKVVSLGATDRDLFVIFEGEASIYMQGEKHRKLITTIPAESVFGEVGFFFNRPRTADVIFNKPGVVARIKYNDAAFDQVIHSEDNKALQQRLWVLHGLLSSPIFQHVPAETMDRVASTGKLRTITVGETIFKQGDEGSSFFVIIQGQVEVFRKNKMLKALKQGEIFGEVALMINRGERTAHVFAKTDGLVLEIQRVDFFKVLAQNLILAKEIEEMAHRRYDDLLG